MQIQQDFCRKLCDQNLLVDKYGMSPLSHILMNLILKFVLFFLVHLLYLVAIYQKLFRILLL
ncbi:hypothetical protein NTHI1209_01600 [Haemophilus influenzae]|uniref:Uncharacterized protein n=1 Tax=Haemophilus influenzae TaxID=727 RepID=A0A158SYN3_HAEIF|nr:hypothetical protein NTHI1209_01600 [Haemophilus influenzae]